jgi:hypothetical protein
MFMLPLESLYDAPKREFSMADYAWVEQRNLPVECPYPYKFMPVPQEDYASGYWLDPKYVPSIPLPPPYDEIPWQCGVPEETSERKGKGKPSPPEDEEEEEPKKRDTPITPPPTWLPNGDDGGAPSAQVAPGMPPPVVTGGGGPPADNRFPIGYGETDDGFSPPVLPTPPAAPGPGGGHGRPPSNDESEPPDMKEEPAKSPSQSEPPSKMPLDEEIQKAVESDPDVQDKKNDANSAHWQLEALKKEADNPDLKDWQRAKLKKDIKAAEKRLARAVEAREKARTKAADKHRKKRSKERKEQERDARRRKRKLEYERSTTWSPEKRERLAAQTDEAEREAQWARSWSLKDEYDVLFDEYNRLPAGSLDRSRAFEEFKAVGLQLNGANQEFRVAQVHRDQRARDRELSAARRTEGELWARASKVEYELNNTFDPEVRTKLEKELSAIYSDIGQVARALESMQQEIEGDPTAVGRSRLAAGSEREGSLPRGDVDGQPGGGAIGAAGGGGVEADAAAAGRKADGSLVLPNGTELPKDIPLKLQQEIWSREHDLARRWDSLTTNQKQALLSGLRAAYLQVTKGKEKGELSSGAAYFGVSGVHETERRLTDADRGAHRTHASAPGTAGPSEMPNKGGGGGHKAFRGDYRGSGYLDPQLKPCIRDKTRSWGDLASEVIPPYTFPVEVGADGTVYLLDGQSVYAFDAASSKSLVDAGAGPGAHLDLEKLQDPGSLMLTCIETVESQDEFFGLVLLKSAVDAVLPGPVQEALRGMGNDAAVVAEQVADQFGDVVMAAIEFVGGAKLKIATKLINGEPITDDDWMELGLELLGDLALGPIGGKLIGKIFKAGSGAAKGLADKLVDMVIKKGGASHLDDSVTKTIAGAVSSMERAAERRTRSSAVARSSASAIEDAYSPAVRRRAQEAFDSTLPTGGARQGSRVSTNAYAGELSGTRSVVGSKSADVGMPSSSPGVGKAAGSPKRTGNIPEENLSAGIPEPTYALDSTAYSSLFPHPKRAREWVKHTKDLLTGKHLEIPEPMLAEIMKGRKMTRAEVLESLETIASKVTVLPPGTASTLEKINAVRGGKHALPFDNPIAASAADHGTGLFATGDEAQARSLVNARLMDAANIVSLTPKGLRDGEGWDAATMLLSALVGLAAVGASAADETAAGAELARTWELHHE